jgi:hypothetical protein
MNLKGLLVGVLLLAVAIQAVSSLLHHVSAMQDEQLKQTYEASISPLVSWPREEGIDLQAILKFINASAGIPGPSYEPNQPDDLYIVTTQADSGMSLPTFLLSMNTYWKHPVAFRRRALTDGLNFVESSIEQRLAVNLTNWPRLERAISVGDFPILINWDPSDNCTNVCCDSPFDPSGTIAKNGKIPVMRFISPHSCSHRLFVPTGNVLQLAKKEPQEWTTQFQTNQHQHPTNQKIPRIVYRGLNPKIRQFHQERASLLDFVDDVSPNYDLGHLQKYVGVLDVDTLDYPQLLCQNSVVLRTEPSTCLDLLQSTLQPFKHYIPVDPDFSNLAERTKYVLDHAEQVQEIVANANAWCRETMLYPHLQDLFLTTLTHYLELLDQGQADWQTSAWQRLKGLYLQGHFILPRSKAYSLPKPTVGAIKQGFRRDDPRYNETSGSVERHLLEQITSKWGAAKQAKYLH